MNSAAGPNGIEALVRSGDELRCEQRLVEASEAYRQALDLDPCYPMAALRLLATLENLGRNDECVEFARAWRVRASGEPVAQHAAAAVLGFPATARCPDAYLTTVFDDFAPRFERQMKLLSYRGPQQASKALVRVRGAGRGDLEVLDAGCGTGLCGPVLRSYSRRLLGVDLSAGMLAQIPPGLYDEIAQAELTAFLMSRPGVFDVIVAMDTLIYFGDLAPVLTAMQQALQPGGHIVFSVEAEADDDGLKLNRTGRYSHSDSHVRYALIAAGLALCALETDLLRYEAGPMVRGFVVTAARPDGRN